MKSLFGIKPSVIWRYLLTQPASFWWVCTYLFFEYVRPQQLFPIVDVLPWGQVTLGMTVLTFLLEGKGLRARSPANLAIAAFGGVIILSTITAWSPAAAFENYIFFFSWALVFVLISNIVVTEKRIFVFVLAFLLYNAQMSWGAMKQWASFGFGFRSWGVTGGAGFFNNSGEFGVAMCMFLPISLYFALGLRDRLPKWKFMLLLTMPASAVFGAVASSSRGALVGVAVVGLWLLVKSKYRARALMFTVLAVVIVLAVLPPEQKARFRESGDDKNSVLRITYWRHGLEMAREHPLLGIGFFNWMPYYRATYNANGQLPHNVFIQAMAELGYTGLASFLALIGVTLAINRRTRRLARLQPTGHFVFMLAHSLDAAMMGFLASGFFVTVLYYPFFWINLSITAALYEVAKRDLGRPTTRAIAPRHRLGRIPVAERL